MGNELLTPDDITRETLRHLHQRLRFVGAIHRGYDDSFAKSDARIGNTLRIRLPNQFQVRRGPTLSPNDVQEDSVSLSVTHQAGVDMKFSSEDLTLSLDRFSERYIKPAAETLASTIESDALNMMFDVTNEISNIGGVMSTRMALEAQARLTENLAPEGDRHLLIGPQHNVDLVDANVGLFNDRTKISKQYRKGLVGNEFFGFDTVHQSTLLKTHTTGSDDGTGDYLINGAAQAGNVLGVDTGAGTFKRGDIITVEGVFAVHPETKDQQSFLRQFVVTADVPGGATQIPISPAIVTAGAKQNVSNAPADNAPVWKRESNEQTAIPADTRHTMALGFHKDAFAFATVDVFMPQGVDFSARHVYDGISLRILRQYDINSDKIPTRLDVMYGFKTLRPSQAVRISI